MSRAQARLRQTSRVTVWLLLAAIFAAGCKGRAAPPAQELPTPVLLVGIDGFRYDYLDLYEPPNLLALASEGARAERLIPSFPSKTFPNHYTLVTGRVPDHHGIVSNNMVDDELGRFSLGNRKAVSDGRWWQALPIWVTAQRAGLKAAALFWPGSEAAIDGVRPTYWTPYDDDLPGADRVDMVLDWLALPAAERPSFLTLYFSVVDSVGHRYGPLAQETRNAVLEVDALLGTLRQRLAERGQEIHWVVVSDHGMAETAPERVVIIDEYVDRKRFDVIDTSPVLAVRPKPGQALADQLSQELVKGLNSHPHVSAYLKQDLPEHLRYGTHPRVAPVIALADEGWRFQFGDREARRPQQGPGGQHGYDPSVDSMGGLLILAGPDIRTTQLGSVDNVDVYSLMVALLDLQPEPNDGSLIALCPALEVEHLSAAKSSCSS